MEASRRVRELDSNEPEYKEKADQAFEEEEKKAVLSSEVLKTELEPDGDLKLVADSKPKRKSSKTSAIATEKSSTPKLGSIVRVLSGTFAGFTGTLKKVNRKTKIATVAFTLFGKDNIVHIEDGRNSVWPNDPHGGWSYCVTVPSWVVHPDSRGSDSVVFYRVQVGIQSPEGITSTRVIFRRFNDLLKLFSELKREFPVKKLPPAPPKKLLKVKSQKVLEEGKCTILSARIVKLLTNYFLFPLLHKILQLIISAISGGITDHSFHAIGYAWQSVNCFLTASYSVNVALDVQRKEDVSAAVFGPGWVYETKQPPDFQEGWILKLV
ncbi:hypothetical protein K1719_034422 [Acacia pycnantha]|nr:hypothetical protein K1719_034422 [Acacia pycnantha]